MLKDGTFTRDARLARLVHYDARSRLHPVTELVERRYRSRYWPIPKAYVLDQGTEGACVGFSVTNELVCAPVSNIFGGFQNAQKFARMLYFEAQKIDPWPGGAYPGASPLYAGTSVLAGTQIAQRMGYIESYSWAFGLRDLVVGLGQYGPSVLGVMWTSEMYSPNARHFICPCGPIVGGHAILARGVRIVPKKAPWWMLRDSWSRRLHREVTEWDQIDLDRSYLMLRNSWGPEYGKNGDVFITLRHVETLLQQQGEAVFFEGRKAIHA